MINTQESNQKSNTVINELKALTFYQQELKPLLDPQLFLRNPKRILCFFFFLALNISFIYGVVYFNLAWYWKLLAAICIGQFNATLAFFAHETLHGAVFKNQILQHVIATICLTPFLISPTYWKFWHNYLHHGNTQLILKDPDAFPTLSVYKRSKFMRGVFELAPGSKNPLSYFYFFYWFSFQAVLNQAHHRFGNKMWATMNHKRVTIEFIFVCLLAVTYLYWIGLANILWLIVIPLLVQNYIVLSYISTNHNISPLTKINDPLENSLTVTNNPFFEFLNLNFGYHVEHHIFPRVSTAHVKKIHEVLKENYPTKYKHMPKWKALKYLYQTPRIYNNATELIHPKTEEKYPTI